MAITTINSGNNNDADQSDSVTVVVGEITSITGPDQCVLCLDRPYTFTVEACCCDSVEWFASLGASPSYQKGGCSFTTTFTVAGEEAYSVVARCGSSQKSTRLYTVEPNCPAVSADVRCLDPLVGYGTLPNCTFGQTQPYQPGIRNGWAVCFDCGANAWKVKLIELTMQVQITYDFKGRWDPDGVNTCVSATCAKAWYDYVNSGRKEGDICTLSCLPQACIRDHEEKHAQDFCESFQRHAATAQAEIAALSRPPQEPCCTLDAARGSLEGDVDDILGNLYLNIAADIDQLGESTADEAMLPCLQGTYGNICELLGESCAACQ